MKKSLLAAFLFLFVFSLPAQDGAPDLFEGGKFYVAPFALATSTDLDADNALYGGGIKVGYDFTRTLALEGYGAAIGENIDDITDYGRAVDQVGADLKLRQPFLNRFAIFESVGVDYNFNERDLFGHGRVGGELKFTEHLGGFADAGIESDTRFIRYVFRAGAGFTF